jgi:hypothetical protein
MTNKKITGIGCFAKPSTLSRVFKKMVQDYTMDQFDSSNLINGHEERGADGDMLLKALIAGDSGYFPRPDSEPGRFMESRKITGFFLTLRNQKLNLSIFARGHRNKRERYTAHLDTLTEMRQKRLN